jgi:hypothetical protein
VLAFVIACVCGFVCVCICEQVCVWIVCARMYIRSCVFVYVCAFACL